VLIELFTGADCPPCVAADLAFEALDKSYKPAEVVLMQYHLHIPGPDPMTTKDCEVRGNYYKIEGTPSLFVNGKTAGSVGGGFNTARAKNRTIREAIEEQLEKVANAKLQLTATLKGSDITLTAKVEDLKSPGEKVFLRFAITEERVRYTGGNGLRYHHCVVRAMPGGPKGFPLTKASGSQEAKLNLDDLRTALGKELDEYGKASMVDFEEKPFNFKNLKAVAFIQDDASSEVIQVIQVDLEEK
jgi:hypothetical protein